MEAQYDHKGIRKYHGFLSSENRNDLHTELDKLLWENQLENERLGHYVH